MEIKSSEFNYGNYPEAVKLCDNESGICLVQYEKSEKQAEPELKKAYSWRGDSETYELYFPKQKQREVVRMAHVCRTSTNCYRVSYADTKGCETTICKTLSEVHGFLKPLWQRKLV